MSDPERAARMAEILDWYDLQAQRVMRERDAAIAERDEAGKEMLIGAGLVTQMTVNMDRLTAERDAAMAERDEALKQQRHGWERHAEKDRAYQKALNERDAALARVEELEALEDPRQAAYQAALAEVARLRRVMPWLIAKARTADGHDANAGPTVDCAQCGAIAEAEAALTTTGGKPSPGQLLRALTVPAPLDEDGGKPDPDLDDYRWWPGGKP